VTIDGAVQLFRAYAVHRVAAVGLAGDDSVTLFADLADLHTAVPPPVSMDGGAGTGDPVTMNGTGGDDRIDVTPASVAVLPAGGGTGVDVSFTAVEGVTVFSAIGNDQLSLTEMSPASPWLYGEGQRRHLHGRRPRQPQ
jgi:hypothetical protein